MSSAKTISILLNINQCDKQTILAWVQKKVFSEPVFITDKETLLTQEGFPYPIFSIETLVSISSQQEESIYRQCHHYRKFFIEKCRIPFEGINLFEDEIRGFSFEMPMRYLFAYLELRQKFANVIIAISGNIFHINSIFKPIIQVSRQFKLSEHDNFMCFDEKNNKFYRCREHFYLYHFKKAFHKLGSQNQNIKNFLKMFLRKKNLNITKSFGFIREKNIARKPCLFITTCIPLYWNNFLPVYKVLSDRLEKSPIILKNISEIENETSSQTLKNTQSFKLLFAFLSPAFIIIAIFSIIRCIYLKNKYALKISRIRRDNISFEFFRYQILSLLSNNGLLFRFSRSLLKTKKIDTILKHYKPSVIYKEVAHSNYDARIAKLAKKHHIPVITSIVASITSRYRNFAIYPCDFITILGEEQRAIFKKFGYGDEQIIEAGQPELDVAKKQWCESSTQAYLSNLPVNYNPKHFTILIATGYMDLQHEKNWIEIIAEYAHHQKKSMQILIKPHPSVGNFYDDFKHLKKVFVLSANTELYPLLIAANLIVTDGSHTGKLAVFFRKPLMVVNFSGKKFPYNNFDVEGVAWLSTNRQEIYNTIDGIISKKLAFDNSNYESYIHKHLTSDDGKATDRIVDLLLQFS